MSPDKIFGLIAAICLLLWILPSVVPMRDTTREWLAKASYLLLGGAIVAALVMAATAFLA